MGKKTHLFLVSSVLLQFFFFYYSAKSQSFIGVNYGELADNLPPPLATAKLLRSTTISKVRLYGVDPGLIQALAGTNISVVIGTSNGDIPSLASDPAVAAAWIAADVLPFHPATAISTISVGNEVLLSGDANLISDLLPAMQNLHGALAAQSLADQIKISTVHSMAVLQQSDPPSSGAFDPNHMDTLQGIIEFLQQTGGPFMVNPYPFFAYLSDPRPETLAFCLFQPNQGRLDSGSGITYRNMFDAQVDAVKSALNRANFAGVEIVVAETGWPYNGDAGEAGVNLDNAKAYNGNLVAHLRSLVGTPLMPGKSVDTYLFALYDEDLKPGPTSERSFGLFKPDLSTTYDIGLAKPDSTDPGQVNPSPSPPSSVKPAGWCVPKAGTPDAHLQDNLDFVCGNQGMDCRPISPGGDCYLPNIVASHAAYAMNLFFKSTGKKPFNCDFRQTGTITSQNPSSFISFSNENLIDQWLGFRQCVPSWHTVVLVLLTCIAGVHDLRKGQPWVYYAIVAVFGVYFIGLPLPLFVLVIWCLITCSFLI